MYVIILTKNGLLGYILGYFSQTHLVTLIVNTAIVGLTRYKSSPVIFAAAPPDVANMGRSGLLTRDHWKLGTCQCLGAARSSWRSCQITTLSLTGQRAMTTWPKVRFPTSADFVFLLLLFQNPKSLFRRVSKTDLFDF
jgi:hypothetical protein